MSNNKKVLFGILGLGRVVNIRLSNVFKKELKNGKVNCIYDIDKKKKRKFHKYFNCESPDALTNFLKIKNDFIYIATESGNHFKHIKICLENNKNVIVEKPPVLKVDQLIYLNKLATKRKLKLYTIFQNRENKSVRYLKKILNKKEKIIFANLSLIWSRDQNYYSDWHGNWKMDGGVLAQQGIHYIDLLNYLLGKPIKCISTISNKSNKLEAEDTHSSLISYNKNISCTLNLSTAFRPRDFEASIKIYCDNKIYILYGLCCNKIKIFDLKKNKLKIIKEQSENVPNGYGISHKYVLQNIIDSKLKKKNKHIKPLKVIDTLDTIKLLNMMYKSVEKNRWVNSKEKNIISKLGN